MEIHEAIVYRKNLINKAIEGRKLTENEREWLASNPIYNDSLGYPYLCLDVLRVSPRTEYLLHIKLLSDLKGNTEFQLLEFHGGKDLFKLLVLLVILTGENSPIKGLDYWASRLITFTRRLPSGSVQILDC